MAAEGYKKKANFKKTGPKKKPTYARKSRPERSAESMKKQRSRLIDCAIDITDASGETTPGIPALKGFKRLHGIMHQGMVLSDKEREEIKKTIVASMLCQCWSVSRAAQFAGVTGASAHNWRRADSCFNEQIADADTTNARVLVDLAQNVFLRVLSGRMLGAEAKDVISVADKVLKSKMGKRSMLAPADKDDTAAGGGRVFVMGQVFVGSQPLEIEVGQPVQVAPSRQLQEQPRVIGEDDEGLWDDDE